MDIMEKTNGRLEPADERVVAHKEGKPFKCDNCGTIQRIVNPEFGKQYKCEVCLKGKLYD